MTNKPPPNPNNISLKKNIYLIVFLRFFLDFFKNIWGVFNTPYKTLKKITFNKKVVQAFLLLFVIPIYTAFSTPIRYGLKPGPLPLLLLFLRSTSWTLLTYLLTCLIIYLVSNKISKKADLSSIIASWAFSLVPTYLWFFSTSFLYFILPPPRTTSFQGIIFSLLFISFSLSLLFWKLILYYLTLRFSSKLNLIQILTASIIILPALIFYSLTTYKLNIFKIPFI